MPAATKKRIIFHDDYDYLRYYRLLQAAKESYPFELHAYCLMPNHIHLLLETIDHSTTPIMKSVHANYAIYFNKRYDLCGHVFQGRYKAHLIGTLPYFKSASRYIHQNPIEAKLVQQPQDYRWSSYKLYFKPYKQTLVSTEKTLSYFQGIEHYHDFVWGQSPSALKRRGTVPES
ncbi:transposase [Geomicrobium sp. JCM 19055]|uniref:transposase n=1 Tax=Geomicrobium sp. JCM 19055 TaxID=1460649 RepID=UPI00223567E2|nr:transposase [Geomicrobium sp. JCM 19055]